MDVKELGRLWSSFMASRILLSANNYRMFDHLEHAMGADELARKLKLDARAVEIVLDALAGLGLLSKSRGKYKNTPIASKHLVSGKPEYQGDIIQHAESLWQNWAVLDEVLLTGLPANRARDHQAFINGMHNVARYRVKDALAAMDLGGVKTALDLGGGPGTYAISLAKKGIDVTLFDVPETMRIARINTRREGVKVKLRKGDFMADEFGKGYDLILISQILHAYSDEDNTYLMKKCTEALTPGGRVYVQEVPISPDLTQPPRSALFSVNMLVNTHGGRCYTRDEIEGWCKAAGLVSVRSRNLGETVMVEGRAPKGGVPNASTGRRGRPRK